MAQSPGSDPPPGGPSPSRFPAPLLPRPNQLILPSAAPPPQQPPARHQPAPGLPPPTAEAVAPPPRGGGRGWQVVIGGAAVLVLLALVGLTAATLLDARQPTNRTAAPEPTVQITREAEPSDLDSRDTDQAPLTAREVFPGSTVTVGEDRTEYELRRTQSSASCPVAATEELADLLVRLGCNQVVRATLRAPDQEHLVTVGLFNLTDRSSAERARERIRQILDERQGRFRGLPAGDETEIIATAPARVGWQVRGHYLAYAVVARVDGEAIRSGDTRVREILFDLLELHLNRTVLEQRANGGSASQPTAAPSEGTGDQNESTED
ncbi:hypothetical protein QQG74_27890 [Micromonospora sp. FIMYZ51]|uniref:hypothetical protein n=1 Tax=Micromonospora sp. FIMYZ51 TaxID=3051832 RepID=UPI00311EC4A1